MRPAAEKLTQRKAYQYVFKISNNVKIISSSNEGWVYVA